MPKKKIMSWNSINSEFETKCSFEKRNYGNDKNYHWDLTGKGTRKKKEENWRNMEEFH